MFGACQHMEWSRGLFTSLFCVKSFSNTVHVSAVLMLTRYLTMLTHAQRTKRHEVAAPCLCPMSLPHVFASRLCHMELPLDLVY
jgi:hypothetical protein